MFSFSAAIRNLFSRKLKTSRRVPYRRNQTRPMLELLEGRDVPSVSVFAPGSIQGQNGWSGGTGAISTQIDQAVDQTGADAHFGVGGWHISNDTTYGNFNGGFNGWVFSPGLSVSAGQPSSLAGADRFSATFFFRSANTAADGSNSEVDLGNTAGNDRATFLAITNKADGDGGLQLRMAEPDPADPVNDYFFPTQIVATNITRSVWHRIDIQATFVDGSSNDTFQVSLDGTPMLNIDGASPNFGTPNWGTFEGYDAATGRPYPQANRLFFRSGAAPSGYGSFSDTGAQGFYIDDVSYKDWNSSAPSTILASYAATFEPAVTPPSTVYVNASWAGLPIGVDPDAAGPATDIGTDAFATIQDGLNAVAAGGTVYVAAGTYTEQVTIDKPVTLLGVQHGVDARDGRPGASESIVSNSEGDFQIEADNVTIDGFTLTGVTADPNTDSAALGAAIWTNPGFSGTHGGYQIVNNIITGNIAGIELDSDGTNQTLVQHNLFKDNTQPGPAGGTDIVVDFGLSNAAIDGNAFTNTSFVENAYGLGVQAGSDHIMFSNNTVDNHGRGVYFYATTNSTVSGNTITDASHYAIGLFGSNGSPANADFTITGNTLNLDGKGVELLDDTAGTAYSGTLTLTDNHFTASGTDVAIDNESTTPIDGSGNTLTLSGTTLGFTQSTTADASGTHTTSTVNIDGSSQSISDTLFSTVVVNGTGVAMLLTNDTYLGTDGQMHETAETVTMGNGAGMVQSTDFLLQFNGFSTVYAVVGHADAGLINGTTGMQNVFVSAGSYSYMTSGSAFYYITGAKYVYGYSTGAGDMAYHYDGSGPSALVMSGTAYSFMLGTDNGQSFFNEAVGFTFNEGIAQHAGQDTAYFYDSPGIDVFAGATSASYMYSDNPDGSLAEYDLAQGFAQVYAYSFVGGTDYAYNYDPAHNHTSGFFRLA